MHQNRFVGFGILQSLVAAEDVGNLLVQLPTTDDTAGHILRLLWVVVLRIEVFGVADILLVLEKAAAGEVGVFQHSLMTIMTLSVESQQHCREVR